VPCPRIQELLSQLREAKNPLFVAVRKPGVFASELDETRADETAFLVTCVVSLAADLETASFQRKVARLLELAAIRGGPVAEFVA
jgi:hypothetical protein